MQRRSGERTVFKHLPARCAGVSCRKPQNRCGTAEFLKFRKDSAGHYIRLRRLVREVQPDLVLVGLGAGLQEQVLLEAASAMRRGYALTCGGFIDQVLQEGYYPEWAYPLKLNWLVRLAREPRRLWRRYTVEALSAVGRRADWRASMARVPGVAVHERMCVGGTGLAAEPGVA